MFDQLLWELILIRETILLALRFEYLRYQLRQHMYLRFYQEDSDRMKKIEIILSH